MEDTHYGKIWNDQTPLLLSIVRLCDTEYWVYMFFSRITVSCCFSYYGLNRFLRILIGMATSWWDITVALLFFNRAVRYSQGFFRVEIWTALLCVKVITNSGYCTSYDWENNGCMEFEWSTILCVVHTKSTISVQSHKHAKHLSMSCILYMLNITNKINMGTMSSVTLCSVYIPVAVLTLSWWADHF